MSNLSRRELFKGLFAAVVIAALPKPLVEACVARKIALPATTVIAANGQNAVVTATQVIAKAQAMVAAPVFTSSFADLVDRRVSKIFYEEYGNWDYLTDASRWYLIDPPNSKKRKRKRNKTLLISS